MVVLVLPTEWPDASWNTRLRYVLQRQVLHEQPRSTWRLSSLDWIKVHQLQFRLVIRGPSDLVELGFWLSGRVCRTKYSDEVQRLRGDKWHQVAQISSVAEPFLTPSFWVNSCLARNGSLRGAWSEKSVNQGERSTFWVQIWIEEIKVVEMRLFVVCTVRAIKNRNQNTCPLPRTIGSPYENLLKVNIKQHKFCKLDTPFELWALAKTVSHWLRLTPKRAYIFAVGSQLPNFFRSPEKTLRFSSDQHHPCIQHVPIVRMISKPKIRGCPNVRIGIGELVGAQLVTLSFSPKFRLLMGLNRSCV